MGNLSKIPAKDLEAKIEQRKKKLNMVIRHIQHLNPINMFWDGYRDVCERMEDGGCKVKNYHGFDVWARYVHYDEKERLVLEYDGKVVLDLICPIGYYENLKEVRIVLYEEGKWEEAFDKIIQMGFDKALNSYIKPIDEAREEKNERAQKKRLKEIERANLESRARSLGM